MGTQPQGSIYFIKWNEHHRQVKENINTASKAKPNHLSKQELEIIDKVTNIYQEKVKVGCTGCEYCLPCPKNVSIPNIFEIYNELYVFDTEENSKEIYRTYIEKQIDALNCIECGQCESMCPQNIEIKTSERCPQGFN